MVKIFKSLYSKEESNDCTPTGRNLIAPNYGLKWLNYCTPGRIYDCTPTGRNLIALNYG